MKKHPIAKILAILGIAVSGIYLCLLLLSRFVALPFEIDNCVLFADWVFIAVPILGFLSSIALQIASARNQ